MQAIGTVKRVLGHALVATAIALWVMAPFGQRAQAAGADEVFIAARDAYVAQDLKRLDSLAPELHGHPLEMYVVYWQLSARIKNADPQAVRAFLATYADTPLADRLRGEWLKELGRAGQWELFGQEYPKLTNPDTEQRCYALQARLERSDAEAMREARLLWLTGKTQPESCAPVFERMIASGQLSLNDMWERMRLVLDAGNLPLARQLNLLPQSGQMFKQKTLDSAANDPQGYLSQSRLEIDSRAGREIAFFALARIARTDAAGAASLFAGFATRVPAADRAYMWGQIAYRGARNHDPDALAWYVKVDPAVLTDSQLGWQARAALRVQEWPTVIAAIEHMSDSEQREANWRYWKARALKAQGNLEDANELLLPLSRESHFYGLLATEELGPTWSNATVLWKPEAQEIAATQQIPGIQRALYLNKLQMPDEARREWWMATQNFDDRKLLAAAEVASRAGWIDRAINTAERTRELHDYSLRFPTPFRDSLVANAKSQQLDVAWVYGLIRQESRFMTDARSSAGALGLMQIMPATAHWIANKLGMKQLRSPEIAEVDTNLSLGTFYLRTVLDNLGDPVLATAGYNAGPARARRWRADQPMEGAIYAETIPFQETRDYVKKVMTNATLYATQLGLKRQSLKERMGIIPGRGQVIEVRNAGIGPGG
jgi:soluble lytic murein transglycosylase